MSCSVLILTFNESVNIAECLQSVAWANDIVVLDSGSTDQTTSIATAFGARVVQHPFDDFATQRNFGLNGIAYKNSWVLMLDADERVTPELRAEITSALEGVADEVSMFRFRRRDFLFGRWIRRSGGYPTWFGRLVRIGSVTVERPVNEEYKSAGQVRALQAHLDHYPFNKGFHEWIAKHDRYSSMEAALLEDLRRRNWRGRDLLASEPARRRATLKSLIYRMPARPLLMFLALYVVRGGVLEGRAGLTFCMLRAWYEFMIDCKFREAQRRARGLPV